MALRLFSSDLLGVSRILFQSIRTRKRGPKKERTYEELTEKLYPDEYCIESYGMKYYPRDKNYRDPPYNPSKLLLIQRVKPTKGVPWYYRDILESFGLSSPDLGVVNIVMNTPESNRQLWKIRHLISVKAIVFPNGEPTEADINRTLLKSDGEMQVSDLAILDPQRVEAQIAFKNDPLRLDGHTLKFESRRRWMSGW